MKVMFRLNSRWSLKIIVFLFLGLLVVGCNTEYDPRYDPRFYFTPKIDEHMAYTEAHQLQKTAFFSFTPPKGGDWLVYARDGTNVILQTKAELPRFEMDVFAFETESNFNSSDDFLSFIKAHKLAFKPNEQLLESRFDPCERFGKFCFKYEFKAKVHILLKGRNEAGDYIFQSHGYDFIHPTRDNLRINIAFAEMSEPGTLDEEKLKEFEDSISTLVFK
jgi:hypothetical protein